MLKKEYEEESCCAERGVWNKQRLAVCFVGRGC